MHTYVAELRLNANYNYHLLCFLNIRNFACFLIPITNPQNLYYVFIFT